MCATAANLIEDVLPEVALRQWVLTFPFPWRRRLAQDGALFGVLTRLFVESVERFYEERAARRGACGAVKSGSVTVVQRTSGDMRLNPHLHVVFLDGAYHEDGTELVWNELGHLRTGEVGQVLEHAVGRMLRYLRRHGHLEIEHDVEEDDEPEAALCASAVSGREPRHTSSPRNGSAGSRRPLRARSRTTSRCALRSMASPCTQRRAPVRTISVAAIGRSTNRAELLRRTCAIDVLECPACKGRMKLVAMVTEPRNIARFLSALGEPTDVPARSPNRGPPYWKSTVVRRKAPGDAV
ncbi:transposase [Sorangium sp. So ce260]|uniref:transposase n=2 Tax=unclassified Sorangium TaxID=2621164 RepID=UPI003F6325F3